MDYCFITFIPTPFDYERHTNVVIDQTTLLLCYQMDLRNQAIYTSTLITLYSEYWSKEVKIYQLVLSLEVLTVIPLHY